jgi:putative PIN family toxin of toxin-antitoxin system
MADPLIVVVDTDVLISTAAHPDKPFAIWSAIRTGDIIAVSTELAIAEFELVAVRPIVRAALPQLETNSSRFLAEYRRLARLLPAPLERFVLRADPKDSLFLNLAIEARAHVLTSFNTRHILALREPAHPQHHDFKSLAPQLTLLHPREFAGELVRLRGSVK